MIRCKKMGHSQPTKLAKMLKAKKRPFVLVGTAESCTWWSLIGLPYVRDVEGQFIMGFWVGVISYGRMKQNAGFNLLKRRRLYRVFGAVSRSQKTVKGKLVVAGAFGKLRLGLTFIRFAG